MATTTPTKYYHVATAMNTKHLYGVETKAIIGIYHPKKSFTPCAVTRKQSTRPSPSTVEINSAVGIGYQPNTMPRRHGWDKYGTTSSAPTAIQPKTAVPVYEPYLPFRTIHPHTIPKPLVTRRYSQALR